MARRCYELPKPLVRGLCLVEPERFQLDLAGRLRIVPGGLTIRLMFAEKLERLLDFFRCTPRKKRDHIEKFE